MAYATLGPTLTRLAANTGASLTQISYGLSARAFGYLVGSVLGGRLYDRVRGHPVMSGVLVMIAALLVAIPLSRALWLLVGLLFMLGMAMGALDVGENTLIVWVHGAKVAPFMNALHFFFGVGAFLSPIVVAQSVLLAGDIRPAYWVLAALMLPVAGVLLRLPSPRSEQDSVPSGIAPEGEGVPPTPALRRDGRLVGLLALFFFLYVGAESSFGGWIATYGQATGLGGAEAAATAAYLTSVFWGALTLGRLLSIPLGARFRPRQVLAADLAGCLVSAAVLLLFPGIPAALWAGTFGAGLFMASVFPTTLSLAERHLTITGAITSLFFVGSSLGGMTVPWFIGQLFERIGPRITVVIIFAVLLLGAAVFGGVVAYTRRSERRPGYAVSDDHVGTQAAE